MATNTGICQPCQGVRDAYHDTVQPLAMCQDCKRWQRSDGLQPILPRVVFAPKALVIVCEDRVQG